MQNKVVTSHDSDTILLFMQLEIKLAFLQLPHTADSCSTCAQPYLDLFCMYYCLQGQISPYYIHAFDSFLPNCRALHLSLLKFISFS